MGGISGDELPFNPLRAKGGLHLVPRGQKFGGCTEVDGTNNDND